MSIRRILASTAVLITVAAAGHAQSLTDQVVSQLTEQGYTRIEVKTLGDTVKVEAQKGGRELEVIYDATTGAVLKQEVNAIGADDDTRPGVYMSDGRRSPRSDEARENNPTSRDGFSRDDDDDSMDDHGSDDDHEDDDRAGRDRSGDHGASGRGGRDDDEADDDSDDDSGRGRGRGNGRGGDDD